MNWIQMDELERIKKLSPAPAGEILDIVLDTDTYNEVDDQFALAYCLLSPERLRVHAVYAAPFLNQRSVSPEDGMEKSYEEVLRLLQFMNIPTKEFVYKGSRAFMTEPEVPVESPAARDLVHRAMAQPADKPLYVAALGAITNVASALLMEPAIAEKIVLVWLGGNPLTYPGTAEFNLKLDVHAVRVVLDSMVPLVVIPCMGVASNLLASAADMDAYLRGANPLCDALADLFCAYTDDHFIWGKEIWDVSVPAWLINPEWVPSALQHTPHLTDDCNWAPDARRHLYREAYNVHRNPIFKDMFRKLREFED